MVTIKSLNLKQTGIVGLVAVSQNNGQFNQVTGVRLQMNGDGRWQGLFEEQSQDQKPKTQKVVGNTNWKKHYYEQPIGNQEVFQWEAQNPDVVKVQEFMQLDEKVEDEQDPDAQSAEKLLRVKKRINQKFCEIKVHRDQNRNQRLQAIQALRDPQRNYGNSVAVIEWIQDNCEKLGEVLDFSELMTEQIMYEEKRQGVSGARRQLPAPRSQKLYTWETQNPDVVEVQKSMQREDVKQGISSFSVQLEKYKQQIDEIFNQLQENKRSQKLQVVKALCEPYGPWEEGWLDQSGCLKLIKELGEQCKMINFADLIKQQEQYENEIEQQEEEKVKKEIEVDCLICMENDKSQVLVPCGHFCLCAECVNMVQDCPMCRKTITEKLPLEKQKEKEIEDAKKNINDQDKFKIVY